jgi:hypothetical protein
MHFNDGGSQVTPDEMKQFWRDREEALAGTPPGPWAGAAVNAWQTLNPAMVKEFEAMGILASAAAVVEAEAAERYRELIEDGAEPAEAKETAYRECILMEGSDDDEEDEGEDEEEE